ncbi:MAG TPA: TonB-dependent receptor [Lacunisphaera sp.]|nr:TonB-dependent receptor [Lacunisphaera sp.]
MATLPRILFLSATLAATLAAQETVILPKISVYSEQVANQTPVSTFPMPVTGLQFEPRVDVQARNLAEGQADVALRGGVFENTGFKLGALSVYDPQTGHYLAELPVAPAMLASPRVLTGAANAVGGFNAEVGTIAYGWLPIASRGELSAGWGDYNTNRQSLYQGWVRPTVTAGQTIGADVELARSESDGSVPFGDHNFKRASGRVQLREAHSQTDFFAGWQRKFFGWPNLYTPFGFNETEDLETELFALNHRSWSSAENFWQVGAYYRRNYDDYEFNRAVPGASNPFQHTTHVRSVALDGHHGTGAWAVAYGAQYMRDNIQSTSLTFGRFNRRDYYKVALVPAYTADTGNGPVVVRAGATYDDTNRDVGAVSPVFEVEMKPSTGLRLYGQYAGSSQVATYTALNSSAASGLFRGNPNLGRETSRNLEAGIDVERGDWVVQAALFRRWDDELVDWTFRQGVTARTANPVDMATTGLEVVAAMKASACDLVLGYTFLEKDADYGAAAATIDASFYALNFAKHRFTAAVIVRPATGFELRLDNEYRIQEKNPLRTAGGNEAFLTSVGLYYLPRGIRGLELSARMDNVWDDDFQEVPAVPAARRQFSVGAAYHW